MKLKEGSLNDIEEESQTHVVGPLIVNRKFSFHIIWRIGPDKQLLSSISAVSKQDSSSELRSS